MISRFAILISIALNIIMNVGAAFSQDYPNKPIRFVTAEAGGILDFSARLIAQEISPALGQPVIVENRGTKPMIEIVARAPADGHTVLFTGGALWAEPLLNGKTYDPLKELSPITLATRSPNLVAVHNSLPVTTIKELIALARSKPGVLNYSSSTAGTSSHLAGELFKSLAGVNIVRIPYKGTAAALNALIGGEVQLMFPNSGAEPQRRAGKIKGLAVTSAEPSALFPGLPPVAASLPGYESVSVIGVFAPVKTPARIINRLNQEIVRALGKTDVKEKFFNTGTETVGSSPEHLATAAKAEMARLSKLVKDANIRPD